MTFLLAIEAGSLIVIERVNTWLTLDREVSGLR